jgi:hypothetical protein
MALPASGQLSIGDIRSELQNTGKANFKLSLAGNPSTRNEGFTPKNQNSSPKPNATSPYAISEWYSYNHSANGSCGTTYTTPSLSAPYNYNRINVTGISGAPSSIAVTMYDFDQLSSNPYVVYFYSTYPFDNTGEPTAGTYIGGLSFNSNITQYFNYTMVTTSDILYIVSWNPYIA